MTTLNRNTLLVTFLLTSTASLATLPAQAEDLYIIANASVTLAPEDVRAVFLGEKENAGKVKLVVLENAKRKTDFLEKVVAMDAEQYKLVWVKKGFRDGTKPPARRSIDLAVIGAVKSTPGAIGYISQLPPDGVKVIRKY